MSDKITLEAFLTTLDTEELDGPEQTAIEFLKENMNTETHTQDEWLGILEEQAAIADDTQQDDTQEDEESDDESGEDDADQGE